MSKILILGGYGNFGKRIATALVKAKLPVIIAGRNRQKAEALSNELGELSTPAIFDVNQSLAQELQKLKPVVVINTCGPFQTANYRIAETCIGNGVHYIDLADGREFVSGITTLNERAKQAGITVISGASTVPGLSSAVIEHFKTEFSEIDKLTFGISPGQKAERGLATTKGIMTYVGKRLKPFAGNNKAYGWQDLYVQTYPELGRRWMANCDIPDLDLLPQKYDIKAIQFSAGLDLPPLHIGLWALSWVARTGIPLNLPTLAKPLLTISNWFDSFGSSDGGMHMILEGKDQSGNPHQRTWFIIAKDSYGPHIPTIPAIHLAKKILEHSNGEPGAQACVGLISLEDYMEELKDYPITSITKPV